MLAVCDQTANGVEALFLSLSSRLGRLWSDGAALNLGRIAESHTAAPARADAAHPPAPYVRKHYHIDELIAIGNFIYDKTPTNSAALD